MGRVLAALWLSLVLAVSGGACSRVQILYDQLDRLILLYVERYVELSADQKDFLYARVDALKRWHCAGELDAYSRTLREIGADFRSGRVTPERVRIHANAIEGYWDAIFTKATPALAGLLARLSPEQVEELFASLEERNAESAEQLAEESPEEIAERYEEHATEGLERWLGSLTPAQEALVVTWSREFRPLGAVGLAERRRWQAGIRALLERRGHDNGTTRAQLRAFLRELQDSRSKEQSELIAHNKALTYRMVARVAESTSSEQIAHLDRAIESLSRDFRKLSCAGAAERQSQYDRTGLETIRLEPSQGERCPSMTPSISGGKAARNTLGNLSSARDRISPSTC